MASKPQTPLPINESQISFAECYDSPEQPQARIDWAGRYSYVLFLSLLMYFIYAFRSQDVDKLEALSKPQTAPSSQLRALDDQFFDSDNADPFYQPKSNNKSTDVEPKV